MTDNGTPGLRETGSLGSTLRRGAVLSAVALVIVQTVSFLQTLVIARLLSPAEIGIFAAGTVLTSFLITFSEGGLRHALIQHDGDVEEVANTVFWATIVTGALMSALMLAASPFVAMVFDSETAGLIAAITSGTLLLHAFTNVPDSLMQRRFDFRRRLIVDPGVAISFAVTSVVLCSSGYGVWGLVIATYASHVVWIASTWGLARWRPGGARPSYRLWRRLARFALPMVLDGFVERIREVIETVVVGRGLSESALGQYRYGRRMAMLPGVAIVQICSYVLFPAFSRIAGEADRLRSAFLRALGWIWFASVPVAFLLVALGEPMVVVLLGERWREAGVLLVAMAGYGLGEAMNSVSAEAMKGAGRSDRLNWMTLTGFVAGIGLLLLLLPLGLAGVGLAVTLTSVLVGGTGLSLARSVVGVSIRDLMRELVPPVLCALAALAVVGSLEHRLVHSDERPIPAALGLLAAESVAFALVYLASIRMVAPDRIGILRSGLRSLLARCRQHAETGAVVPDHNPAAPLTPAPYLGPTADPGARNRTTASPDILDRRTRSSAGGAAGRREGPNEHRTEQ